MIFKRDGPHLMLSQAPNDTAITPHWQINRNIWNVRFRGDDVDALFAEFTNRGATIDYGLGNKPYGIREFGIQDLDGYDAGFGQPL